MTYLLFDIGGTKMRVAVSQDLSKLGDVSILETPKNFKEGMLRFREMVNRVSRGKKIEAAAGGVAGPLDKKKTKLVNSPNIQGWINKPLKSALEKAAGAPVFLENDADLGGLGEAIFGAGRNKDIAVYITIGTGVGGTRVVCGKIDRSAMGSEPGHQIVPCRSPNVLSRYHDNAMRGEYSTIDDCISGAAIYRRYKKLPSEIMDKKIWDEAAQILAIGLNNTIAHWSPDVIVLGGAIMDKISIGRVCFYLKKIFKIFPKIPLIKKTKLDDVSGLYGAMALLKQKWLRKE